MENEGEGEGVAQVIAAEVPPAQPLVWPSVVTLLLAFIGMLLSGCLLGAFLGQHPDGRPMSSAELMASPAFIILATGLSQLSLLVAVWKLPAALGDLGPSTWRDRVRWLPERFSLIDVLLTAVPIQIIGSVVLVLLAQTDAPAGILPSMSAAAAKSESSGFAALLLFGAIAPGLAEELAFRGLLQTRLVERWGVFLGVGVSALLFGLWHFDVKQGLMAAAMGVWIGWCAHRQRTVVNVAFAHALNNAFAFIIHRSGLSGAKEHSVTGMMVSVGILALCVGLMWRRTK